MARAKRVQEIEGQDHLSQLVGDEEVKPIEFDHGKSFQFFTIEKED